MIVLDTNVISELVRAEPEALVVGWVDGLVVADTFITAVTAAELLHGVARLPGGRRRTRLADLIHTVIEEDFAARVLAFDVVASGHYADIAAHRSGLGRPISQADAQTASHLPQPRSIRRDAQHHGLRRDGADRHRPVDGSLVGRPSLSPSRDRPVEVTDPTVLSDSRHERGGWDKARALTCGRPSGA